jgi:RHS repeat-associated protein
MGKFLLLINMRQKIKITSDENKEFYNGKALVDNHNLFWYHYGARYGVYPECFCGNPQLGRWHAMDPADEFNSPYVYVGNDPSSLIPIRRGEQE